MPFTNPFKREPAPPGFGAGKIIPEVTALWPSKLIFRWLSPFLTVGYSRPLEKEDLWSLPEERLTDNVTDNLEVLFFLRCEPETRPKHLREQLAALEAEGAGPVSTASERQPVPDPEEVPERGEKNTEDANTEEKPKDAEEPPPSPYDASLIKALYQLVVRPVWISGLLTLSADTLRTTTPLVSKVLLTWLAESYLYVRLSDAERSTLGLSSPRGIAYGIGVAIGMFAMQEGASLMTNHSFKIAMTAGQIVRTGVIGATFRKSLRISGRARQEHSVGQIITMISTDATHLELFLPFIHQLWVAPIQLILGIGLLIGTLGYSALVGLGVMVLGFPIQFLLVQIMFKQRNKAIKITDKRVQLTTEVLQGIRLIKCYGWETFYLHQIGVLREGEVKAIRKSVLALSFLLCIFHSVPIIATIISFITYSVTGHSLNIGIIFASLQLFNIIRMPLILLPLALSSMADAMISLGRASKFLSSEELEEPYVVDPGSADAVTMDGDFTWEAVRKSDEKDKDKDGKAAKDGDVDKKGAAAKDEKKKKKGGEKEKEKGEVSVLPSTNDDVQSPEDKGEEEEEEEPPFELKNLKFSVPKGALVGIVGRIGSGKSSLFQALIGEMRRTRGEIVVGGSVAYVPQAAWIQNATLRENILFGRPDEEARFREVVRACSLEHDIESLPHGESTEIGEKGINLSGGQKARVSLARAAYSESDIVLLDDPLSAVDAYVGRSILDNCLLNGPLASRTRILVTHALHVLDKMDYIYVMENGIIVEQGTYEELLSDGEAFSRLIDEYGTLDRKGVAGTGANPRRQQTSGGDAIESQLKEAKDVLMQLEERSTGAVEWETYKRYFAMAGGVIWVPVLITLLLLNQAVATGDSLWLGFWTGNTIHGFKNGQYMAVYAAFGAAEAIMTFLLSFAFFAAGLVASLRMFKLALNGIVRSPLAFFDTTPMGRILSRLSKDQETLDAQLAPTLYSFLTILSSVIGVIVLIFYTFPYLGIALPPLGAMYYIMAIYYRASSVEVKRLDSILRSALYASVSESLTGLATIRAYKIQRRLIATAAQGLDVQNRAHYMAITIQRWLAIRLDFYGNLLILGIGLFAAGFRHKVDPSKIGVVLSYTLSFTMIFSELVSQFAQNEQNMNTVERVLHYTELPSEGALETPNDPDQSWPRNGEIKFTDVQLAYRPGLPLVLKDVTFSIRPQEKVGIIGRTGAGKTSLLQALFRTVELEGGSVEIDGFDVSKIGLETLRSRLALVPQDITLFMGTLRDNLDPHRLRTDAEIISAMQRVSLLPPSGVLDQAAEDKFRLDASVNDEGSNFSAGEKQLLALCRALVRNNKIIVLDEATSNVDVETDAKVQRTIQTEFSSSTLLCIAHRLNTIAYYDRVLVMDKGTVAEFDTVLNLFDREGSIFRALCDEANLSRADIVRIRAEQQATITTTALTARG